MKFTAINELTCFEFHDANIEMIDFRDKNMIWKLSAVNATKENSQNHFATDMCIDDAEITFEDYEIVDIIFGAYKIYDSNQVLIESAEARTAQPDEYCDILNKTLSDYCYILSMEETPREDVKQQVCFDIDGGAGNYTLVISFSKSIVQWDEFNGKAWYEDEKWKKK